MYKLNGSDRPVLSLVAISLLFCFFSISSSYADDKKDGKKEAHRMAQMKAQFEQEKSDLEAQFQTEKTALEAKIKQNDKDTVDLKASLDETKKKVSFANSKSSKLEKENTALLADKQKLEASLAEAQNALKDAQKKWSDLNTLYDQSQHDLAVGEAQRKEVAAKLQRVNQDVAACEDKNEKMHSVALDLIKTCEQPSAFQKILRSEPFSQIKHVELENALQDYRDKFDEQKFIASVQ